MNSIFIIIGVALILILMFSDKAKKYVKKNKDLVLCLLYLYMSIWFSFVLFHINSFETIMKYIKKNPIYILYLVVYIAIPLYFLYNSYKSYKDYKNKKTHQ